MRRFIKNLLFALLIFVVIAGIFSLTVENKEEAEDVSLSKVAEQVNAGSVETIEISENELLVILRDGKRESATKESESSFSETLTNLGVSDEALRSLNIEIKNPKEACVIAVTCIPLEWKICSKMTSGNNKPIPVKITKGTKTYIVLV